MYKTRHQEFINNLPTDWDIVSLNSIGEIRSGGTPSRDKEDFWNGKIPWVTPSELTSLKTKYLLSTQENITEKGLRSSAAKLLPIGSLLVTTRATIGNVAIASMSVSTNQGFKNIVPGKEIDSTFYYYLLGKISFEMKRLATGTTFDEISRRDFEAILVPKPSLSEQRRIAEILDTLDETIRKTEALIGKLKQVKAGLLHDLLTRGIDEQGQLRNPATHPEQFKDSPLGRIPREWRVGQIKDLATNLDGKRVPLKQDEREKMKGEIPYYGASGIIDNIDSYLFEGEFVLLGEDGENVVSRNLPLAFRVEGKIWVNNHAHVFKPHKTTNSWFLAELLESVDYTPYVSGSAQPKLTQAALDHLLLPIPPIGEQTSIANVIKSHSTRIQKEQSYLNKLQQLKKGLMEDLLTGKVRVNELEEVQA